MTKLAGIFIRKNTKGRITHLTIDVEKHGNALSLERSLQSTLQLVDNLFDEDAKSKN